MLLIVFVVDVVILSMTMLFGIVGDDVVDDVGVVSFFPPFPSPNGVQTYFRANISVCRTSARDGSV